MWQLDGKHYWAEERTVVPGDNMAEMFWNAVALRGALAEALRRHWNREAIAASMARSWDDVAAETLGVCEEVVARRAAEAPVAAARGGSR